MAVNVDSDLFVGSEGSAAAPGGGDGATVLTEGSRPMRADAVKNRKRILEAAEEIFAVEGVTVPIDVVAERAGVGIGTLYRHFPNKEALFEAIVIDHIAQLIETAGGLTVADDPGAALFALLRELAEHAAAKRDLFDALTLAGIDFKSGCAELVEEMMRSIEVLVGRAVIAGAVRDDLSSTEIVGLVIGTCHASGDSGADGAALQRMIGVVIDGLQPSRAPRSTA